MVKNKISKIRRQARKLLNTRSHLNLDKYTFIMTKKICSNLQFSRCQFQCQNIGAVRVWVSDLWLPAYFRSPWLRKRTHRIPGAGWHHYWQGIPGVRASVHPRHGGMCSGWSHLLGLWAFHYVKGEETRSIAGALDHKTFLGQRIILPDLRAVLPAQWA